MQSNDSNEDWKLSIALIGKLSKGEQWRLVLVMPYKFFCQRQPVEQKNS